MWNFVSAARDQFTLANGLVSAGARRNSFISSRVGSSRDEEN